MDNKIKCRASNCKYHCENDDCTAAKVSVGNPSACTSNETYCDTFIMKN